MYKLYVFLENVTWKYLVSVLVRWLDVITSSWTVCDYLISTRCINLTVGHNYYDTINYQYFSITTWGKWIMNMEQIVYDINWFILVLYFILLLEQQVYTTVIHFDQLSCQKYYCLLKFIIVITSWNSTKLSCSWKGPFRYACSNGGCITRCFMIGESRSSQLIIHLSDTLC